MSGWRWCSARDPVGTASTTCSMAPFSGMFWRLSSASACASANASFTSGSPSGRRFWRARSPSYCCTRSSRRPRQQRRQPHRQPRGLRAAGRRQRHRARPGTCRPTHCPVNLVREPPLGAPVRPGVGLPDAHWFGRRRYRARSRYARCQPTIGTKRTATADHTRTVAARQPPVSTLGSTRSRHSSVTTTARPTRSR